MHWQRAAAAPIRPSTDCFLMATLANIPGIESFIREAVQDRRMSHEQVGINLRAAYPNLRRGLSTASIKQYCLDHDIHKTARIDQSTVNRLVSLNVMRVR